MGPQKRVVLLVLALCLLRAYAFGAVSKPNSRLVPLSKEVQDIFVTADVSVKRSKIGNLVSEYFDFEGFAKLTIDDYWKRISLEKRNRFLQVFRKSFIDSIYDRCTKKSTYDFKFKVKRIKTFKDYTEVMVNVRVDDTSSDVSLIWVRVDKTWKMIDVTVSGANLIVNYKAQFSKMIDDHGFDYLLERLEKRL